MRHAISRRMERIAMAIGEWQLLSSTQDNTIGFLYKKSGQWIICPWYDCTLRFNVNPVLEYGRAKYEQFVLDAYNAWVKGTIPLATNKVIVHYPEGQTLELPSIIDAAIWFYNNDITEDAVSALSLLTDPTVFDNQYWCRGYMVEVVSE